jgi:hypothetical protein
MLVWMVAEGAFVLVKVMRGRAEAIPKIEWCIAAISYYLLYVVAVLLSLGERHDCSRSVHNAPH